MSDARPIEYEESSGNVFEDIGFDTPTAARLAHKADLVGVLHRVQRERGLSQSAFARLVGIPQPRLSRLYNGRISGMSTDKLLDAIAKLGGHVTIRVEAHPAPADAGRVELEALSQHGQPRDELPTAKHFFERTRFEGSLAGHGSSIPIGFTASVDDLGRLQLELDRIPFSPEAYALHVHQRPGTPIDEITLRGESEAGHLFRSDSFFISHYNHSSQEGQELTYQGQCDDAEFVLPKRLGRESQRDARVWLVRQLRTFRRMARETPLGRIVIGGPRQNQEAQEPNGFLAIFRPDADTDETWWQQSELFLTHLARVLSFACDTYLRPVIEERYSAEEVIVRVVHQPRASSPFMPPFHELHMQPIFDCACDSFFSRHDRVRDLDAAIRWLTAPVAYDESRLLNAMSAIENILDRCGLPEIAGFMANSAFKSVAKKIRALLKEIDAPAGMSGKVAELNRRPLADKVKALLRARDIVTRDMPNNWLRMIISQRNLIVHTGVSGEIGEHEPDTLDYTIWAREIAFRLILERLGFRGAYRSWLHHDEQLRFPECITMQEWVAGGGRRAISDPEG